MTASSEERIRTEMVAANGLEFEVMMAGNGDKLALLLHGFPEHAIAWRRQLPFFAELGYTVWAPCLRGYGKSSRPKGIKAYRVEALLDDIAALVKASGKTPSLLIGHDWGGTLAWCTALRQELRKDDAQMPRFERLVIMNTPHPAFVTSPLKQLRAQPKKFLKYAYFQVPFLADRKLARNRAEAIGKMFTDILPENCLSEDDVDIYRNNAASRYGMTAMLNWYRAVWWYRAEEWNASNIITMPTLMIWGESASPLLKKPSAEDISGLKRMARSTAKFVRDFTLTFFADVTHWAPQEAPKSVNAIIKAWLTGEPIPKQGPDGHAIELA